MWRSKCYELADLRERCANISALQNNSCEGDMQPYNLFLAACYSLPSPSTVFFFFIHAKSGHSDFRNFSQ